MSASTPEPTPPRAMIVVAIILIAFALIALYANVQKFRRDEIETVITTPVATPTPAPLTP